MWTRHQRECIPHEHPITCTGKRAGEEQRRSLSERLVSEIALWQGLNITKWGDKKYRVQPAEEHPKRKVIAAAFWSLDGMMQAPGGLEKDPTAGFQHGGQTSLF